MIFPQNISREFWTNIIWGVIISGNIPEGVSKRTYTAEILRKEASRITQEFV